MKLTFRQLFFFVILIGLFATKGFSSHIRAGEILARNVNGNPLEYEFTVEVPAYVGTPPE
jgi:hypothetical protein